MKNVSNLNCKPESGKVMPSVGIDKCEAKGPCLEVCPYGVFEIQKIKKVEYESLPFIAKIKTRVHKMQKAYVIKPQDCHACGLCVPACPEKAIKLVKFIE